MEATTADFDELIRGMKLLSEPIEKFLEFTESVEDRHRKWGEVAQEVERLQGQVNQSHKTIKTLEMKLKSARHLLDVEKGRRIAAENDKTDMAEQIFHAIEMLGQGQVIKTREAAAAPTLIQQP